MLEKLQQRLVEADLIASPPGTALMITATHLATFIVCILGIGLVSARSLAFPLLLLRLLLVLLLLLILVSYLKLVPRLLLLHVTRLLLPPTLCQLCHTLKFPISGCE
jgi:hypothetical protein